MSQPSAIDILVEALTDVPEFDNPLTPIYAALSQGRSETGRPLTLKTLRQHTELLHDHVAVPYVAGGLSRSTAVPYSMLRK